jgi:hypothetical protein
VSAGSDNGHRAAGFESGSADCRDGPQPVTRPSLEEAFTMPRDACGDRLPERSLDVGAAALWVTRCFQFSQVVSLESCRTTPRYYEPHPQPQQPRSGRSGRGHRSWLPGLMRRDIQAGGWTYSSSYWRHPSTCCGFADQGCLPVLVVGDRCPDTDTPLPASRSAPRRRAEPRRSPRLRAARHRRIRDGRRRLRSHP